MTGVHHPNGPTLCGQSSITMPAPTYTELSSCPGDSPYWTVLPMDTFPLHLSSDTHARPSVWRHPPQSAWAVPFCTDALPALCEIGLPVTECPYPPHPLGTELMLGFPLRGNVPPPLKSESPHLATLLALTLPDLSPAWLTSHP